MNQVNFLRATSPQPHTTMIAISLRSADRVASSDFAQYFYWRSPSPLGGPLSRGWCYREQVNNYLEVVVGGEVLEEVALLLHDAVELVDVDLTVAIAVGLVDHVLELLIIDGLAELLSHAGEVAEGDLVGVVVVEELEHLLDVLTGILLAHLGSHHAKELGELNGAVAVVVDVGDHLLELLVLDLEAKGAHGGLELTDVDHAGGIG